MSIEYYIQKRGSAYYRLHKNKTWKQKNCDAKISDDDYLTTSIFELIVIQKLGTTESKSGFEWFLKPIGDPTSVQQSMPFHVYAVRDYFPILPSEEQLISVMKQGDDPRK